MRKCQYVQQPPHLNGCDKIRYCQTLDFLFRLMYNTLTALSGELAVPCYSQSATVRLNVAGGFRRVKQESARSVDTKVLCNVRLSTVSGWGHSSTTQLKRVPQGSFGVATYRDTVSASSVNCKCAVFANNTAVTLRSSRFFVKKLIWGRFLSET